MSYLKASSLGVLSRFVSAGCRIISLPLVLSLLDPERYGLWLMLTSLTAWLALTDLGIPSALQNPLVERLALGDLAGAGRLIRHAYLLLSKIAAAVSLIAVGMVLALPIGEWLSVPDVHLREFHAALATCVVLIALSLPLRLGGILAYAMGRAEVPPLSDIATQLLSLALIALFAWGRFASLFALVIAVSLVQVFVSAAVNLWLSRKGPTAGRLRQAGPASKEERRQLRAKGGIFLLVLIGEGLVLQSDAFLLGHFKGASAVTAYLVPHTLFMQFIFIQNAFLRPIWATFTRHSALDDRPALRRLLMRGLRFIILGALLFGVGFGVLGDWFVNLWSHGMVRLSPTMAWGFGAYAVVASAGNLFALFCNAVGLVERRLYGIMLFGTTKVVAGAAWLHYREVDGLPWVYALVCVCTDVAILAWMTRRFLVSGREAK